MFFRRMLSDRTTASSCHPSLHRARTASPPPRRCRSTGPSTAIPLRPRCSCCTADRARATSTCSRRCSSWRRSTGSSATTSAAADARATTTTAHRSAGATRSPTSNASRWSWASRPLHIVGYSWGGLLAMLYAIEAAAGRIATAPASLALIDPAPDRPAPARDVRSRVRAAAGGPRGDRTARGAPALGAAGARPGRVPTARASS